MNPTQQLVKLIWAIENSFRWENDFGQSRGPGHHHYCPLCRNWKDKGHKQSCPVALAEEFAQRSFGESMTDLAERWEKAHGPER